MRMKLPRSFYLILSFCVTVGFAIKGGSQVMNGKPKKRVIVSRCLSCTEQEGLTFEECLGRGEYEYCKVSMPDCASQLIHNGGVVIFASRCHKYQDCLQEKLSGPNLFQCNKPPIIVTTRCQYCCLEDELTDGDYCAPPGPENPPPIANYGGTYGCNAQEVEFGERCYLFNVTKTDHQGAREWCADNGYQLTSIRNEEEFEFLRSVLSQSDLGFFWIGAQVRDDTLPSQMEHNWCWVDGTQWTWDLGDIFHPNSPDNKLGDELCAAMVDTDDEYRYYVDDQACNQNNAFICRRGNGCPISDRWLEYHSLWRDRINDCLCYTWGEEHYITFDGTTHHYNGNCTYVHVVDRKHNPPLFSIQVKNQLPYEGAPLSGIHHVIIRARDHKITLHRKNVVWVDDYPVSLPNTPHPGIHIMKSGRFIMLLSSYGFWVKYDGSHRLVIGVSGGYRGHTAGVCGVCDGDPTNDDLKPNGHHAESTDEFLNSWNSDGSCVGAHSVYEVCPEGDIRPYRESDKCGIMRDENGMFADCLGAVSFDFPFESCLGDMCHGRNQQEKQNALCDSINNYFDMCREAGISLMGFRSDDFCPLSCPAHSHYSSCTSPCPATCATAGDCHYTLDQCVEGCECDTNYILSGSSCVHRTNCGCVDDYGHFYMTGETWTSPDCRRECTCVDMNEINCEIVGECPENAECVASFGRRRCRCKPGYAKDKDGNCVDANACSEDDEEYKGQCYKIVNDHPSSFHNAKQLCEHSLYQLASILSEDEYTFLRQTLKKAKYNRNAYWVGADGRQKSETGVVQETWRWTSGDLWTWSLDDIFAEGTPDNKGGNEFCGKLQRNVNFYMNDDECGSDQGFICKKVGDPLYGRCQLKRSVWRNRNDDCKCYVFGDPHYKTFDGKLIHFKGNCSYALLVDWANGENPKFVVNAKNVFQYTGSKASVVRFVVIKMYGMRIILRRQKVVTVDDIEVTLPHNPHPGVSIAISGRYVTVLTDLGFWVQFDGVFKVKVGLDASYGPNARGMCGLCDGDPTNDYLRPDGQLADDDLELGDSWRVEESCDSGYGIITEDGPICPNDDPDTYNTLELCGRISDPNGHFAPYHEIVSPDFFVASCVFDMCHAMDDEDKTAALCDALSSYYDVCRDDFDIGSFRSPSFCPHNCPRYSTYNPCMTPCPATCVSADECSYERCVEGCECDKGYVLIGDDCVPKSDCGCVDTDGNLHKRGDTWVTSDCKRRCTCRAMDDVKCEQLQGCPARGKCVGQDGDYACQCTDGYHMNDKGKCVETPLNEYDCRLQCHGVCRHQGCDDGQIRAPDCCTCRTSLLSVCCIDDPAEVKCESRGGVCRESCHDGETECLTDCKCYSSVDKCCVENPVSLQCESSCDGVCRDECKNDEKVSQSDCTCSGGEKCCIHDPSTLKCVYNCGGFCRDSCREEEGNEPAPCRCTCSEEGQVCCTKRGYIRVGPHERTFDGKRLLTDQLCSYILTEDCVNTPPQFQVVATTRERLYITKAAINVDSVIISVGDTVIHLLESNKAEVDGTPVALPVNVGKDISIEEVSSDGYHKIVEVVSAFGLNVFWNGKNAVYVDITSSDLHGKVCGLFGNANDVRDDDFTKQNGKQMTKEEFIDSWILEGSCQGNKKRHSKN
ncbi:alpha-tectorin-like [Ptychodera flava]|uniref:alpha-tectorin-like n=1 Tax=Ptychodera flava TaxID=63121 RepID=UPI00396A8E9C